MKTALQQLLDPTHKSKFVEECLLRQPISVPGAAREFSNLGSWNVLGKILAGENPDVMVVRQGEQRPGPAPADLHEAQALCRDGCTILVRHAETHHAGLQGLADDFARDFHAPVNVHMYLTPPGEWGFPWHYDAEEVFILQTAGGKEYSLRKNTVNPWPTEETLPADMQYEREIMPLMRVELAEGDWLYIPSGWWHKAETTSDEVSISLAVGVMARTAMEAFDFLRRRLVDSMLWRQRLPISGAAAAGGEEELQQAFREVLRSLAEDFSRQMQSDKLIAELREHFAAAARGERGP